MVYNCYIKCQVCGSITRVRLQVGWQQGHPIVVTCGKCRVSLAGNVKIGQNSPSLEFKFSNADILNNADNADFVIECSGEFPTIKQYTNSKEDIFNISPFIRNMDRMRDDFAYEEFGKAVSILNNTAIRWKAYKRILDLFQNNNEYLVQEIKKVFQGEYFQCRDKSEILRAVHMIEIRGFISPLRKDILDELTISSGILKLDNSQLGRLIEFLNNHDGYHIEELQALIYKILEEFVEIYSALIPALVMQYYKENLADFELEGSTTSTFDSVKQFYLDSYESLGNLLVIPVALNNIKYRGDFEKLSSIDIKVSTIEDFIELTKANRYRFCIDKEMYTEFLHISVNSKLRNAIGHNDVDYDTASQLITYIPNPKDRTKKVTEYLLEFENEAMRLFQGILVCSEYLYRLREIKLIFDGNVPVAFGQPISKQKKIGRNDQCPCGSGFKYKFCHGKSM